jgi:hypothetical protein
MKVRLAHHRRGNLHRTPPTVEFPSGYSSSSLQCSTGEGYAIVQVSHRGGPASVPGQVMWDFWWTKSDWGRFSPSASVSPANSHSTNWPIFSNHTTMDAICTDSVAKYKTNVSHWRKKHSESSMINTVINPLAIRRYLWVVFLVITTKRTYSHEWQEGH